MRFHWNWWSEKGLERSENQDFAGIAYGSESLLAVLADGVFSRPGSGELAKNFVYRLVDRAVEAGVPLDRERILQWIKEIYAELRCPKTPKRAISFLVAVFSANRLIFLVHAGDCRAGLIGGTESIVWKNQVHSLATATVDLSDDELKMHPARNQLTRSFSTKRFIEPELNEIDCVCVEGAVLATDGFWAAMPLENQEALLTGLPGAWACEDDVSRLIIRWGIEPFEDGVSLQNLYVRQST